MEEYKKYPPEICLKTILRSHPALADVYIQLWKLQNAMQIRIKREDINYKLDVSPTLFKNHCLKLSRQGFLDFREYEDRFIINLYRDKK